MYQTKMDLTGDELAVLKGEKGDTLRKVMESVVRYGEVFGAKRLIPLTGPVHLVTSFGIPLLVPVFEMMDELIAAGLKTKKAFTVDPRPLDYADVRCTPLQKLVFRLMYGKQREYEQQLAQVGLKDRNAFTCTCYMDEVGNKPAYGDILAWAESSAVIYANSVLGARTNRNSGIIELFCGILGKTPEFGFVTDEGRKAGWVVEVRTGEKPNAQLLGSAVGMKVMDGVPYIKGLDKFFGGRLTGEVCDYLKDMGAAEASNGAVGLYHVEGLTPEAVKYGDALVKPDARTYVIDDAELERVRNGYPLMWKDPEAEPKMAFIGCPHLSLRQLRDWTTQIEQALRASGRRKLAVPTVLCAAPDVAARFRRDGDWYGRLWMTGARLTSICPLMYMNNPLCARRPVATNSNKLRTYTTARFYSDGELLTLIAKGAH